MTLEVAAHTRLGDFELNASFASDGRVTAIFGASGVGKTTLVNIIAGLLRPERGRVAVEGDVLLDTEKGIDVPVYRRRVGYVFQDSRLFPHLSVKQNLLYGRWFTPDQARYGSFDDVVDLLGLRRLLDRGTAKLSGGEKQRVAIGRALLVSPCLLLLDEPLASLDEARKAEVMPFLEHLRDSVRVPIVYVSHSLDEVVRLASTLVVLAEGRAVACGPTTEVMSRIGLFPAAGPDEAGAVLEGIVVGADPVAGLTSLQCRAGLLRVPRLDLDVGAVLRVRVLAHNVIVAVKPPEGLSALNVLPGKVLEIGPLDAPIADIALDCNGEKLLARLTRHSIETLQLKPGRDVYAVVKSVTLDHQDLGSARPSGISRSGELDVDC